MYASDNATRTLAGLRDAGDVAAYLRTRDVVIVCDHGSSTTEEAIGAPEITPTAEPSNVLTEPEAPAVDDTTTGEGEEIGQVRGRRQSTRRTRKSKKGQEARNPIRSHREGDDRYGV